MNLPAVCGRNGTINVKVTIMRQMINETLYGVNMYIQCIALHIVLNNSKSQQDGEHYSFQSMNTEKGVAIKRISSLSYISHPVIARNNAFGAEHLILMSLS